MQQQRQQTPAETPPMEILRKAALARGVSGIKSIGRMFRIYDDNGSKRLDYQEFVTGCKDYGVNMSDDQFRKCFLGLDQNDDGSVSFDEFLQRLRPPMSNARKQLIDQAFNKLDQPRKNKDGDIIKKKDGVITVEDLMQTYDVSHHPKFKSGEWTKKQVLEEFLKSFQVGSSEIDEVVTRDEFINYYAGVSASIDKDVYFDYMMRQCWKL